MELSGGNLQQTFHDYVIIYLTDTAKNFIGCHYCAIYAVSINEGCWMYRRIDIESTPYPRPSSIFI